MSRRRTRLAVEAVVREAEWVVIQCAVGMVEGGEISHSTAASVMEAPFGRPPSPPWCGRSDCRRCGR